MENTVLSKFSPLINWSNKARAVSWLLLIEEDHSYTFKTTEQRYKPGCKLPYGPVFQSKY